MFFKGLCETSNYCEFEAILQHTISGFRIGHSTCIILMAIRDDLLRAMAMVCALPDVFKIRTGARPAPRADTRVLPMYKPFS